MRTDHYALKFMLDRLSCQDDCDFRLTTVSRPSFTLFDELCRKLNDNAAIRDVRNSIVAERGAPWRVVEGLILYGARVLILATSTVLPKVMELAHYAGHEGIPEDFITSVRTLSWNMNVLSCATSSVRAWCASGTKWILQPLACCSRWRSPRRCGPTSRSNSLKVFPEYMARASSLPSWIASPSTPTSSCLAIPTPPPRLPRRSLTPSFAYIGFRSIVNNRDLVFTGNVWHNLFKLAGVKLRHSTAIHPQTDGQSEAVNKTIAMYLRCITGDRPRTWLEWLPCAEYCYNTSYHSALHTSPFQVVYDRPLLALLPYTAGTARIDTMETDAGPRRIPC